MSRFTLALVALARAVRADYVSISTYLSSTTCAGNSTGTISDVLLSCTKTSGEDMVGFSYELACTNSTGGNIVTYASDDCSGEAVGSVPLVDTFGCTINSADDDVANATSSLYTQCLTGAFVEPFPAISTYRYNDVPATDDDSALCDGFVSSTASLTSVSMVPVGPCVEAAEGVFYVYTCDASGAYVETFPQGVQCTGSSSGPILFLPLGCYSNATEDTVMQVFCNASSAGEISSEKQERAREEPETRAKALAHLRGEHADDALAHALASVQAQIRAALSQGH